MEMGRPPPDNPRTVQSDLAPLLDRIRLLVDEQAKGAPEHLLERMEHTLTDGYAHALALEGESIRIERQIGQAVTRITEGDEPSGLDHLAERLASTERELSALRTHLDSLRDRTEDVRGAAAAVAPR
jgi:hypothetical protein